MEYPKVERLSSEGGFYGLDRYMVVRYRSTIAGVHETWSELWDIRENRKVGTVYEDGLSEAQVRMDIRLLLLLDLSDLEDREILHCQCVSKPGRRVWKCSDHVRDWKRLRNPHDKPRSSAGLSETHARS